MTQRKGNRPAEIQIMEDTNMKNITKKELNRIAKKYGYDPQYL